jgi:hypothetical protein
MIESSKTRNGHVAKQQEQSTPTFAHIAMIVHRKANSLRIVRGQHRQF